MAVKVKYGIRLYSKHCGDSIVLGSEFSTMDELKEYAEKNVCSRCNRYEIEYIHEGYVWIDKKRGFMPSEYRS